jgi:hypothetical protein
VEENGRKTKKDPLEGQRQKEKGGGPE